MGGDEWVDSFFSQSHEPPDPRIKEVDDAIRFLSGNPLFEPIKRLDDLGEGALIFEAGNHYLIAAGEGWKNGLYPAVMAYQLERLNGEGIKPLEPNEFHIRSLGTDGRVHYGMCVKIVFGQGESDGPGAPYRVIINGITSYFARDDDGGDGKNQFRSLRFSDQLIASGTFFRLKEPKPTPDQLSALIGFNSNVKPPDNPPGELFRCR